MNFQRGRRLAASLLLLGAIMLLLSLMLQETQALFSVFAVFGMVSVVCGIACTVIFCKCPYCNRVIMKKLMVVTECPYCKRDLLTGLVPKKKRK